MKRPYIWGIIYGIILAGYTTFTLLDAFVIPHNVTSVEESADKEKKGNEKNEKEAEITENSYVSENISITIQTIRKYETDIHIADVKIKSADSLRTALANGKFGRNVKATTSQMAKESDAILAINGDYYGFRDDGYVMRNGQVYRETLSSDTEGEDLVIDIDGNLKVINEEDTTVEELIEENATQILSFGPGLIKDGEISVEPGQEVGQAMHSNPRTAIGMVEPLHYIMVVSDGRTFENRGLSLVQLAEVMLELKCQVAYNLDGGGSATMWFMGKVLNQPMSGRGEAKERRVSDIVYIGK